MCIKQIKFITIILLIILFCVLCFLKYTNISRINKSILKNNSNNVFNLELYKNTLTKEYITNDFVDNEIKKSFDFDFSKIVEYKDNYKYGVAVKRANLRFLPTNKPYYKNKNKDFDYLQNSEIKFNEPLLVLFEYENWYFVQLYNAIGWVEKNDIAIFETKKSFVNYVNDKKFLIVIDKNIFIDDIYADMGVKINYIKSNEDFYDVIIPRRDSNGYIYFESKNISKNGLNIGYLKFNKNNILKQAYKYLGTEYGWGGSNNGIDCSGFVLNVYSSFGIKLPRDSINQQKSTSKYINISKNTTHTERLKILKKVKVGSLLYFKGHIMLYLGFVDKTPCMIHSVASYENNRIMSVVISDSDIKRNNGISFIDSLSSVTSF